VCARHEFARRFLSLESDTERFSLSGPTSLPNSFALNGVNPESNW